VRRSARFVPLDSPANALQPYKQNDNGWDQGQIFFSPSQVWMQPPFYAQQMAAKNHQPLLVESSCSSNANLDYTATRNEAGDTIVLHIVNYGTTSRGLTLNLTGFGEVGSITSLSLNGALNGENTPEKPTRFVPVEQALTPGARIVLKPNSYNVIVISSKDNGTGLNEVRSEEQGAGSNGSWFQGARGNAYDLSGRVLMYKADGFYIQDGIKWLR
ncbi:MAG: alpha-L-arabinofuranosidase C-terminal domain-containing protein, partial [Prevotella sp.]